MVSYPIPGSFLRGSVTKDYVTIEGPTAKVLMLTRDAHALMHWLYDALPYYPPHKADSDAGRDMRMRESSYSQLWLSRRMAA